jgi:hypothetical protein
VIAHVVLLQPKPELGSEQRHVALQMLSAASAGIPGIARFRIGRRILHGLPGYEQAMTQDFEFALVLEFEDVESLKAYLQAPAHGVLGHLFTTATTAALAYDYDLREPGEVAAVAERWTDPTSPRR